MEHWQALSQLIYVLQASDSFFCLSVNHVTILLLLLSFYIKESACKTDP
jgi:hypothetical protein